MQIKPFRLTPKPAPVEIPLSVRWELLERVYSDRKLVLAGAFTIVLLAVIGNVDCHAPWLYAWSFVGVLAHYGRLLQSDAFFRRKSSDPLELWVNRCAYGAWGTGAIWGALSIVIDVDTGLFLKFTLTLVQSSVIMGASMRFATVPKAASGVYYVSMVPLFICCFGSGHLDFMLISILVLVHIRACQEMAQVLWDHATKLLMTENSLKESNQHLADANLRLETLAVTDGLTGLVNRRGFDHMFETEWLRAHRERRPIAVVMFDIDFFKKLNDSCGHLAGDDCLRELAACLRETCKRPGDVVARYGGEEFVALLHDTDMAGARHIAESLRAAVALHAYPHPASPAGHVTVSAGVASAYPNSASLDSAMALLNEADKALYAAKQNGRNQVMAAVATA